MNRPAKSLTTKMYAIENFESLRPVLTLEFMRRTLAITHSLQYAVSPTGLSINFNRRDTVVKRNIAPEAVDCGTVALGISRRNLVTFTNITPDAAKVSGLQLGLNRRDVVVYHTKQPESITVTGLTLSISRTVQ